MMVLLALGTLVGVCLLVAAALGSRKQPPPEAVQILNSNDRRAAQP